MTIRVEFFGIARRRAGVTVAELPLSGPVPLRAILHHLQTAFPALADECLLGDRLRPSYVANIDGQQFVHDPEVEVPDNANLLIMSANAGG